MKIVNYLLVVLVLFFVFSATSPSVYAEPARFGSGEAGAAGLSKNEDAGDIINTVIGYLTALLAGLFVLMMIVGAIWYMVFPDPGKKQEGMKIIQAAIIAGVFALLSFAIWMIMKEVLGVGSGGGGAAADSATGL